MSDQELKVAMGSGASVVDRLVGLGRSLGQPIEADGCAPVVIVPRVNLAGEAVYEVVLLPAEVLKRLPDHVRQVVTLQERQSFEEYVNAYKSGRTRIFGRCPSGSVRAEVMGVMDYHSSGQKAAGGGQPGNAGSTDDEVQSGSAGGAASLPDRCAHRAVYPCPFSEAWKVWSGVDRKPMKQGDFVDFLEDNMGEIQEPDGALLLELASNFKSAVNVQFASKIDRTRGTASLQYTEEPEMASGGGVGRPESVKIVEALKLVLPVFHGGKDYEVTARVRWKVEGKALTVTVVLQRPDAVILEAFADVLEEIATNTGIVPLLGAPDVARDSGSW